MTKASLITTFLSASIFFFYSPAIQAKPRTAKEIDNVVNTKLERFFDLDKNKHVNLYERALINTHLIFGWPLAKTKKKKEFDYNDDNMLQPFEERRYLEWKKTRKPQFKILPTKETSAKK